MIVVQGSPEASSLTDDHRYQGKAETGQSPARGIGSLLCSLSLLRE